MLFSYIYKKKYNMKRTIKLTESDLHKFIKESVENILTELDPRTYANYAKQRTDKGQYDKAARGTQAAVNAWNKKYGTKDYERQKRCVLKTQNFGSLTRKESKIFIL
jgi:hypothetical protein